MNNLEDRLRDGLHAPGDDVLAESMLARVHAGARRRRQRSTGAIVAATVAVVLAGSTFAATVLDPPERHPEPLTTPVPTGVVDLAVPDTEHLFALTDASTVWLRATDGSWQELHHFAGSVEYVEFAPDARNGWAWGSGLWSTHDGGQTWAQVETGPGRPSDRGHWVHLTSTQAWSLYRSDEGNPQLWWTPIGADDWTDTLLPSPSTVVDIDTVGDHVVALSATEGAGQLTLLTRNEVDDWTALDLPCAGENQPYPAESEVFVLCPANGGATIRRSMDLTSWQDFGQSKLTSVTAVLPLSDDRLLLVGEPNDLLVTPSGSQQVDVGLVADEEIFQNTGGIAGDTAYLVTSEHRILVSTDAGENWSELD